MFFHQMALQRMRVIQAFIAFIIGTPVFFVEAFR